MPTNTKTIIIQIFLLLPLLFLTDCAKNEKIKLHSYMDKESAGWSYKRSDMAFVAEKDSCRIQWNVIEYKDSNNKLTLSSRISYPKPFNQQIPLHRAVFKEIFSKWSILKFDKIMWFRFGKNSGWSWSIPLAIASYKSEEYKDYKLNYPNSKVKNINELFVNLANESDSYQEFSADVELYGVEKVFSSKAHELPFYSELEIHGINENSRLMFDNHVSYFKIIH